jgi:hypothetical protein
MRSLIASTLLLLAFAVPAFAHEEGPARNTRALGAFADLVVRIHAASHSLENVANRIDVRTSLIAQQSGADMDGARASLDEARLSLANADARIDAIANTSAHEPLAVMVPRTLSALREALAYLYDAKTSLRDAVEALKEMSPAPQNDAVATGNKETLPEVQ